MTNIAGHHRRDHKAVDLTNKTRAKLPQNCAKTITSTIWVFVASDMLPYSVVENPRFSLLEPRYEMPSRFHFTTKVLPSMSDNVKQKVTGGLRRADLVALITDCWSFRAIQSYMTMTTHYIECALFTSAVKGTHCRYKGH